MRINTSAPGVSDNFAKAQGAQRPDLAKPPPAITAAPFALSRGKAVGRSCKSPMIRLKQIGVEASSYFIG